MSKRRIVVGISGATGAIYGIRVLESLSHYKDVETHLVLTDAGALTIREETDWDPEDVIKMADYSHNINNIGASISSGSFNAEGMIIAPCAIKSMSMIANSMNANLLIRAADVMLKEKRKLIVMVRETPLHEGHLELITRLARIGAVIFPPVPAFYSKPKTLDDIINHTVGRILNQFGLGANLVEQWTGLTKENKKHETYRTTKLRKAV